MKDGIIKGDGTSRKIKGALPATYDGFKQAVEAGEQTLDVMFNAPGWQQQPTFLNKQNLGQDKTMAVYNRGPEGTVDDLFQSVFAVGDIKVSTRTDLGDSWLLCNGETFSASEYPDLGQFTEKKAIDWPIIDSNVGKAFYAIKYANGYWFATNYDGTFYSTSIEGPWEKCIMAGSSNQIKFTEIVYFKGRYYAGHLPSTSEGSTILVYSDAPEGPWNSGGSGISLDIPSIGQISLYGTLFTSEKYVFILCKERFNYKYHLLYSTDPVVDSSNKTFKNIPLTTTPHNGYGPNQAKTPIAVFDDKIFVGMYAFDTSSGNNPKGLVISGINSETPSVEYKEFTVAGVASDGVILSDSTSVGVYSKDGSLLYSLGEYDTQMSGQAYEIGNLVVVSSYSDGIFVYDKMRRKYIGKVGQTSGTFYVTQSSFAASDGAIIAACLSQPTGGFFAKASSESDVASGVTPEVSIPGAYAYIRGK